MSIEWMGAQWIPIKLLDAHQHSMHNRSELASSEKIGCFHCLNIVEFSEIQEWTDKAQTGVCPACGIDSLVGSASGIKITDELLDSMKSEFFAGGK